MPSFVYEVIVVDNGCSDNSQGIAKKYNARVLTEKARGYGSAISSGLKEAEGEIIVIIDADGSYPVQILEEILNYMQKAKLDFVSGCRLPLSEAKAMPFINKVCNYFISWLIRFLFKINIVDSQSGMMVFKRELLNKIRVQNTGMGFSQEIKIKVCLSPGMNFGEFHILYLPRIGKIKFSKSRDSIKNLYDVLALRAQLSHLIIL